MKFVTASVTLCFLSGETFSKLIDFTELTSKAFCFGKYLGEAMPMGDELESGSGVADEEIDERLRRRPIEGLEEEVDLSSLRASLV